MMRTVRLSMGEIDYTDTGGPGRVVRLCHGLLMDASIWDDVVALCPGLRVVRSTFPLVLIIDLCIRMLTCPLPDRSPC